ncbi:CLUMA_CG014795, isoform A [Clunio marinus]|uniref:CLUMA_CG014795, isoform A n=1 Tax=Clunio marinus TaxID=568069 RepID=A0A1J1IME3_9DIPT|nr:CLUMA_CG014795, isoform A [Clunio marinus]
MPQNVWFKRQIRHRNLYLLKKIFDAINNKAGKNGIDESLEILTLKHKPLEDYQIQNDQEKRRKVENFPLVKA